MDYKALAIDLARAAAPRTELRNLDEIMAYVQRSLDRDTKPYTDGILTQMRRLFQYRDRLQTYPTDEILQEAYLTARYITREVRS